MSAFQSEKIVLACRRLYDRNLLAGTDGNVSVRINKQIFITPSGVAKAFMSHKQIACVDLDGNVLSGKPSTETLLHLQIYRECKNAKAVVHAHPPHAIAWTIAHPNLKYIPTDCLPEVILAMGNIPIAPYAIPGTKTLAESIQAFLPHKRAMMLARHGALTWGESLDEALNGLERIEHVAQILSIAHQLGGAEKMDDYHLKTLKSMREEIGEVLL